MYLFLRLSIYFWMIESIINNLLDDIDQDGLDLCVDIRWLFIYKNLPSKKKEIRKQVKREKILFHNKSCNWFIVLSFHVFIFFRRRENRDKVLQVNPWNAKVSQLQLITPRIAHLIAMSAIHWIPPFFSQHAFAEEKMRHHFFLSLSGFISQEKRKEISR